ncbi:MAG: prolipoprotein diacylglyceryl transferase [Acidimicrobiales bacterium]|nr:prolipoprotein diacylglyceryl transferase [Acidimicrobiales bacterium]
MPPLTLLASIPSPSVSVWEIGPFSLHLYGLCIALGVVAAVTISSRRWQARGGHPDDITTIALWAVPAGVIGARLYHVITDWKKYQDDWAGALNITQGGLGIPGGIALGVIVGLIVVRRNGWPTRDLLDVVAPAIPVAQAIGRLGNWFNQEVFGKPSDLPWALEIDLEHRPAGLEHHETFHPTFLYEGLWNLALAGFLVWLDRRKALRRGELFLLYVFGYSIGRLWVENIRSDEASLILGVRVNIWMSVIVALVSAAVFAWNRRKPAPVGDLAPAGAGVTGAGAQPLPEDGSDAAGGRPDEPGDGDAAEPDATGSDDGDGDPDTDPDDSDGGDDGGHRRDAGRGGPAD